MTNTVATLDAALEELIIGAIATAEAAGQFVVAEVPIVIEQLLAWRFWMFGLMNFLGWSLLILSTTVFIYLGKKLHEQTGGMIHMLWVSHVLIVPVCLIELCNLTWLQILIAPKLYLLEYAAELIR